MEEAIRRRLLADGEGTGDDKRISTLQKTFLKWAAEKSTEAGTSERYCTYTEDSANKCFWGGGGGWARTGFRQI